MQMEPIFAAVCMWGCCFTRFILKCSIWYMTFVAQSLYTKFCSILLYMFTKTIKYPLKNRSMGPMLIKSFLMLYKMNCLDNFLCYVMTCLCYLMQVLWFMLACMTYLFDLPNYTKQNINRIKSYMECYIKFLMTWYLQYKISHRMEFSYNDIYP